MVMLINAIPVTALIVVATIALVSLIILVVRKLSNRK